MVVETFTRPLVIIGGPSMTFRAVEIDSQFVLAYSNRGASYAILGEYRRAIEDFDRVLSMNPRFVQIYNYRGYAYESVGNHRQAIEDYNKALEINPRFALAYNNRGSAYGPLAIIKKLLQISIRP